MKEINLLRAEAKTGKTNTILTEQSDTYLIGLELLQGYTSDLVDMRLVTLLGNNKGFMWMSERSGSRQLYQYGDDGNLIRPITNELQNGIIKFIVDVDTQKEWVYFTAHSDRENPYHLQIFRASLKTDKIEKLADSDGIFDVFFSPAKDSLWVLRTRLPAVMELDVYTPEGEYLSTPWKGNTTPIANGYFNFEYPRVLAADNKTTLEALLLKPSNFEPNKTYPVVESIYGGSFDNWVIRNLFDEGLWEMQALANKGFIVVLIDGRATPGRGKVFKDFNYGKIGQVELQDHVAALKQIGKDRPYMDMQNIGIIGHSLGGHFALRALLEYPNIYKAGHLNAPAVDAIDFRVWVEAYMGCLPQDCPEKYEKSNITDNLGNLRAPIMIVHGTADDDVPIEESIKLVEKLKALDYNDYQFIKDQGADHVVMKNPEWLPTMIDFFLENLKN